MVDPASSSSCSRLSTTGNLSPTHEFSSFFFNGGRGVLLPHLPAPKSEQEEIIRAILHVISSSSSTTSHQQQPPP
ncbi:hypothetical protein PIB30_106378, partial [Stylosanthes scabra]|nr:hypothetical protein [Stylosanthes scabra]